MGSTIMILNAWLSSTTANCQMLLSIACLKKNTSPSGIMLALQTTMQNHFDIEYQGEKVGVEYRPDKKEDEYLFVIQLKDGSFTLQCQKDNEGAFKWLEEDDRASERATDIGTSIEKHLVENGIDLSESTPA